MVVDYLIPALLLGLGGSLHCLGMCGPFALSLQFEKKYRNKLIMQNTLYQIGRAFTYALIGVVAGLIGIGIQLKGFMGYTSIIIGVLMILSAFMSFQTLERVTLLKPIHVAVVKLKMYLQQFVKHNSYGSFLVIGLLNGFLPCGLVITATVASITAAHNSAFQSTLFMFVFGLGTIPLMFATVMMGNLFSNKWRLIYEKIIPFVIVIAGLMLIYRGYNFLQAGHSCCHQ